MPPHRDTKLQKEQQKATRDPALQKVTDQPSKEEQGDKRVAIQPSVKKLCYTGSSYFYACPGRKPQLLVYLQSYLNKELQSLSTHEPKFQEMKLQVYRDVFGCFIKEFKTYQPLLSEIKREYESTLAYQQGKIQELEPLRSLLRLVAEECDHKIQARWAQEHTEIAALKKEKEQLHREIEAMKEREKAVQAVVGHLQSELSQQYLLYRQECDARKLLIRQLNNLTGSSTKEEHVPEGNPEAAMTPVKMQHTLEVHPIDPTKDQEEAESWDAVPQCNSDTLEKTLKQTLLQLTTLQGDFDQLKNEYDTLLALHQNESMKSNGRYLETMQITHVKRGKLFQMTVIQEAVILQMDKSVSQEQSSSVPVSHLKVMVDSDAPKNSSLTVPEFRLFPVTAFPQTSGQEKDELLNSSQSPPDNNNDNSTFSFQTLHSVLAEFGMAALPGALDQSKENCALGDLPSNN